MLEPISMDQGSFFPIQEESFKSLEEYFSDINKYYPGLSSREDFKENFDQNLKVALNAGLQVDEVYSRYKDYFPINRPIDTATIFDNVSFLKKEWEKNEPLNLNSTSAMKRSLDIPSDPELSKVPSHIVVRHFINGNIRIYNLLPVPLKLVNIIDKDNNIIKTNVGIIPGHNEKPYIDIETTLIGIKDDELSVVTELGDQQRVARNDFSLIPDVKSPFIENISEESKAFLKLENDRYYFSPGTWNINEALVLDKPVIIPPGTKLLFSNETYLMIHGSLQANGTIELPIEFSPQTTNTNWGGIYVRLAKEKSTLNNVSFTATNEFQAGILKLTGGVTFYKSDVSITNSTFQNNNSEDALNIIESDFLISNSNFHDSPSDALDSDFSTGLVVGSNFSDIAGDALDYSGSTVIMRDLFIKNIKDKGVSGGENSYLTVEKSIIENSDIGIASKDGSEVKVFDVTINKPTSFSLMTYVKKSFWGTPSLSAENVRMDIENSVLAQYGTELFIDGIGIEAEGLDVKSLYQDE